MLDLDLLTFQGEKCNGTIQGPL